MRLLKIAILSIFVSSLAHADESRIPEPFRGEKSDSPVEINYSDWSFILRNTVIGSPRSGRGKALRGTQGAPTGSRLSGQNKSDTRNEGNRINLKVLAQEENLTDLTNIRQSLERVPSDVPMKHWKKEEQLAYWLNLYNVTLIENLAQDYPFRKLKRKKRAKDGLWTRKLLNVAGVPLSLNDIQYSILPNKWDSTLFIYGLFQGYIGGPSIQKRAFTGKSLEYQLMSAAREFVNSNRGTKIRGNTLKVSEYFKDNAGLFPDWQNDIKGHVAALVDQNMKSAIHDVTKIKILRTDYFTTDLFGGGRYEFIAQSNNPAALLFANSGSSDNSDGGIGYLGDSASTSILSFQNRSVNEPNLARLPASSREYLINMQRQNAQREGEVHIAPVEDTGQK